MGLAGDEHVQAEPSADDDDGQQYHQSFYLFAVAGLWVRR